MKRKNYFKYILTIVTILLLNISNKVYSQNVDKLYEKIDLFSEVLEKIQNEYVDEVDQAEVMDSAINGALQSLDRNSRVRLYTDSEYLRSGITTWINNWKKNGWRTSRGRPVKNKDLWQGLDEASQGHRIDWRWVKGHAGNSGNERADTLANQAIDRSIQRQSI